MYKGKFLFSLLCPLTSLRLDLFLFFLLQSFCFIDEASGHSSSCHDVPAHFPCRLFPPTTLPLNWLSCPARPPLPSLRCLINSSVQRASTLNVYIVQLACNSSLKFWIKVVFSGVNIIAAFSPTPARVRSPPLNSSLFPSARLVTDLWHFWSKCNTLLFRQAICWHLPKPPGEGAISVCVCLCARLSARQQTFNQQ